MNASHDLLSCAIPTVICPLLQTSKPTLENDLQHHMLREWLPHFQDQARGDHKKISSIDRSNSDDNQLLSEGKYQA